MPVIIVKRPPTSGTGKSSVSTTEENTLIVIDGSNIEVYTEDDAVNKMKTLASE